MKKNKFTKYFLSALSIASSLLAIAACSNEGNNENLDVNQNASHVKFDGKDLLGRDVHIDKNVDRILCIGASALRLYSYVGDMSKLCAVEAYEVSDTDKVPVRPYNYAYREVFKSLPSIKSGGPMQPANPEAILSVKPDVIFSLYNDVEKMNKLESTINIPVVCLSYGMSDPFSDEVTKSLDLIGKISKTEEKANEKISYIKSIKKDLNTRTSKIKDENKPSVYLAYNTYNGGKGNIGDTLANYTCFKETNANNVLAGHDFGTNNPSLDLEKVVELNPDIIFVDVFNYEKLVIDYKSDKRQSLNKINAFKNNQIYIQMPFNQYYTNIDIAMADCYFIGQVMFQDEFKDIKIEDKYNEILSTMLNKEMNYYARTISDTKLGFTRVDLTNIK